MPWYDYLNCISQFARQLNTIIILSGMCTRNWYDSLFKSRPRKKRDPSPKESDKVGETVSE